MVLNRVGDLASMLRPFEEGYNEVGVEIVEAEQLVEEIGVGGTGGSNNGSEQLPILAGDER